MKNAKEFRAEAWSALTGRYWWAVLAGLIAAALGGASSNAPTLNYSFDEHSVEQMRDFLSGEGVPLEAFVNSPAGELVRAVLIGIVSFAAAFGIALFIIGGAVELGYSLFNVKLFTTGEKPVIGDLFSRFSIFGRALWLRVLMALKIFAWMLLFIVPGIIAAYRYAMAPYILAEHPDLTASEAIERSKALMQNNKWRLFCLGISFIGWYLLAALTAGVGFVFLLPYERAANAAFYLELTGRPTANGKVAAPEAEPAKESAPLMEPGPVQL